MRRARSMALVIASALALVGAAGCGDDDGDAAETGTTPTTEAPAEETTSTTEEEEEAAPAEVTTLDVTAVDFGYELGGPPPTLEPGLVEANLTNTGTEEHQATLIRLNDGVGLDDFAAAAAGDPTGAAALNLATGFGGPNGVAPEGSASTTQNVVAGDYLMICFIPSPSDGVPHAVKGMLLPFTVEGDDVPATLPEDELAGEIELAEFSFGFADDFGGQGTYTVANDGEQTHEAVFYALADGATLDDALAVFAGAAPPGPPPFTPAGGVAAIAGQRSVDGYVTLDLPPGEYAVLCFLPDVASDGAPHFTKGMALQVSIS